MNKKKICLVIHSLQAGGMERTLSELTKYMCQRPEAEVHLVMYGIKPEIFYSVPQNLIVHQPNWKFDNSKRIWNTIKRLIYLRRTVKRIAPDTMLSFGECWNSFVLLALSGLNFPMFVSDRCQPDKSLGFLHDNLRKWLYPKAAGIIAQTNVAREIYLKQFHHPNIQVIGNPIRSISAESGLIKENIVLSVGRLIKSKHHDELIKMFVRIGAPGWKLVIVGGKALNQDITGQLQNLVKKLNAEESVVFAGNRSDVDSYYQKSRIFAFTSSSEGFPNVIGEAMSAGLPVIAFDCMAGPSEMMTDKVSGILVPLFDYKSYETKLKKLMGDEELRNELGKEAEKSIRRFDVQEIGKRYYSAMIEK